MKLEKLLYNSLILIASGLVITSVSIIGIREGIDLIKRFDNRREIKRTIEETTQFTLKVSEYNQLSDVIYDGMPNDDTFSLSSNNQAATNQYYPANAKQIFYRGRDYNIISVDANQITLRGIR